MNNRYRFIFLIIAFVICGNFVFSQNDSVSLEFEKKISSAENNDIKQKSLIDLYNYQLKFNWFDAINTCNKGIDLFRNSNAEYTSFWYLKTGQIYIEQGLYILSLINLYTALEIEEKNNLNKGETYLYIAKNYYLQNHFNKSFAVYENALEEFNKLKKTDEHFALEMIAKTYNKLGIVYDLQGNYPESGKYFQKALKMRLQIDCKKDIIDSYTSLGYFYDLQNKSDSAIYWFTKGIDKCYKYNNFHYLIDLYLFRSYVYKKQKNFRKAYSDLDKATKYAFTDEKTGLARIYYYYSLTDFAKNDTPAFNKHIDSAFQYIDSFNINSVKLRTYKLLIKQSIKANNYKKAYYYENELNKLEEINSNEKLLKAETEVKSEIERMKMTNLEISNKTLKSRNRLLLISIFFGILSLLLLSGIIFLNIRKNKLLNRRKKYFKTLFNISPFGIAVIDKLGNIKDINKALLSILNSPSYDKVIETENIYKIKDLQRSEFIDDFNHVLKTGEQSDTEFSFSSLSEDEIFLRAVNVPIKNNYDEISLVYSIIEDISERKKMQKLLEKHEVKLKESNETKDKFLSIIAHDLINPFGAIMSLSELLHQNFKNYDDTKKEDLIRLISEGAKNTYNLLENLLTWARSQKGEIKYFPKILIINKMILENISLFSDLTAKKNISVIFDSDEEITGFADYNMLNFIIRNLFTNAIKFTPKDGQIKFSLEKTDNKITVCIEDTGIGMDKNQIDSLFRIEKASSQRGTENETGTGLGLILSKEFIDFHKGKIRVQSELGKGSTFCVELPI